MALEEMDDDELYGNLPAEGAAGDTEHDESDDLDDIGDDQASDLPRHPDIDDEPDEVFADDDDDQKSEDDSDDEGEGDGKKVYGPKLQKRIDRLTASRRQAEERAAAAEARLAELQAQQSETQHKSATEQYKAQRRELLQKLEDARFNGDTDAAVTYQEELEDLRQQYATPPKQSERQPHPVVQDPPQAQQEWVSGKDWLHSDPVAFATADAALRSLEQQGYDPNDAATYAQLDKELAKRLPEHYPKPQKQEQRSAFQSPSGGPARNGEGRTTTRQNGTRLTKTDLQTMRMVGMDPQSPKDRKAYLQRNAGLD